MVLQAELVIHLLFHQHKDKMVAIQFLIIGGDDAAGGGGGAGAAADGSTNPTGGIGSFVADTFWVQQP